VTHVQVTCASFLVKVTCASDFCKKLSDQLQAQKLLFAMTFAGTNYSTDELLSERTTSGCV